MEMQLLIGLVQLSAKTKADLPTNSPRQCSVQCEGSLPAFVSPEADRRQCFQAEQTLL